MNIGECHYFETKVNHTIGSTEVTLEVYLYDEHGHPLNLSPRVLNVPVETLVQWGYDFSPVTEWVARQLSAVVI